RPVRNGDRVRELLLHGRGRRLGVGLLPFDPTTTTTTAGGEQRREREQRTRAGAAAQQLSSGDRVCHSESSSSSGLSTTKVASGLQESVTRSPRPCAVAPGSAFCR